MDNSIMIGGPFDGTTRFTNKGIKVVEFPLPHIFYDLTKKTNPKGLTVYRYRKETK